MSFETNVRQRKTQDKDAMKEKLESIKKKMKEEEAKQEWKNTILIILKPFLYIFGFVVLICLLYYWYNDLKKDEKSFNHAEENMFQPNEMRETYLDDADETEHLYLEQ